MLLLIARVNIRTEDGWRCHRTCGPIRSAKADFGWGRWVEVAQVQNCRCHFNVVIYFVLYL